MSIGGMKEALTIQRPVLAQDGGGGFETSWEDVAEVYARIEDLGGGEAPRHGQTVAENAYRLTLHHRADVTADMRLAGGGKIYEIVSLRDPDGRGATLEITARSAA